jgi:hypothetical protein
MYHLWTKGLVRVSLPGRARVSAPAIGGRGTTAILPSALRVGDRLKATAPLSKAAVKRLRKRAVPSFRAKRAKVARRASVLSNDELTRMLADLSGQLNKLTGRVDGLASLTSSQLGGLRSEFRSTTERVNTSPTPWARSALH